MDTFNKLDQHLWFCNISSTMKLVGWQISESKYLHHFSGDSWNICITTKFKWVHLSKNIAWCFNIRMELKGIGKTCGSLCRWYDVRFECLLTCWTIKNYGLCDIWSRLWNWWWVLKVLNGRKCLDFAEVWTSYQSAIVYVQSKPPLLQGWFHDLNGGSSDWTLPI